MVEDAATQSRRSSVKDKDKDSTDLGSLHNVMQVRQYTIAHKTSLLVYNKGYDSNTKELVRKFRPEFEQIFVASDVKSFISFIDIHNNDLEHQEISMVILESDQISMRILDYLNKRVAAPKTSAFPLISSVVLVPPNADSDVLQNIEAVGGTNAVIHLPSSSFDILSAILEVLYRRRLVESTFRDLKEIDQTERYPYLSIFAQHGSQLAVVDGDESVSINGPSGVGGVPGNSFAVPNDMSYIVVKNNEDWTNCSTMLPRALKKLRRKERSKRPASGRKVVNTHTERLHKETSEREKTDNAIMKKLTSAAAVYAQQLKSEMCDNENIPFTQTMNSGDSRDSRSPHSSPSDSGSDSSDDDDDVENPLDAISIVKRETIKQLLDPKKRPKWCHVQNNSVVTRTSQLNSSTPHPNAVTQAMLELDLRLFVDKYEPDLSKTHTVGGLDKATAEKCWRVIHGKGFESTDRHTKHQYGHRNTFVAGAHRRDSFDPELAQSRDETSTRPSVDELERDEEDDHTLTSHQDLSPGGIRGRNEGSMVSEGRTSRPVSGINHLAAADSLPSLKHKAVISMPTAMKKATGQIHRMVKGMAPDVQVHKLIKVQLYNRKINIGDRDLFERGLKYEVTDENEQAIMCYIRAGKHSNDPHLSRLFLGAIYFKQGLYLLALKQYNTALRMISEIHGALYSVQDDFCVRYNRAVTNFRLGDDRSGLIDLDKAVLLCPKHAQAKEMLSLVHRRMGAYMQAITHATDTQTLKREKRAEDIRKIREAEERQEARSKLKGGKPLALSALGAAIYIKNEMEETGLHPEVGGGSPSRAGTPMGGIMGGKAGLIGITGDTPNTARRDGGRDGRDGHRDGGRDSYRERGDRTERGGGERGGLERGVGNMSSRSNIGEGTDSLESRGGSSLTPKGTNPNPHSLNAILEAKQGQGQGHGGSMGQGGGTVGGSVAPLTLSVPIRRRSSKDALPTSGKKTRDDDDSIGQVIPRTVIVTDMEDRSFRAKKDRAMAMWRAETIDGEAALNKFKRDNGYKTNLFENFFLKASPLQEGRGKEHIAVISCTLRLLPFLRGASDAVISGLAGAVEYRTISNTGQLYSQNANSDAACFLLKGRIEMRMEGNPQKHSDYFTVGDVEEMQVFGHLDFLFRDEESQFMMDLNETILEHHRVKKMKGPGGESLPPTDQPNPPHPAEPLVLDIPHTQVVSPVWTPNTRSRAVSPSFTHSRGASPSNRTPPGLSPSGRTPHGGWSPSVRTPGTPTTDGGLDRAALDAAMAVQQGLQRTESTGEVIPLIHRHSFSRRQSFMLQRKSALDLAGIRASAPGMFMSYTMLTPCELLVVGEKHFHTLIYKLAVTEFDKRLEIINASAVFATWSLEDKIRLARMGHLKSYRSGDCVLKQGEHPTHLFFVVKGMCKAYKRPHEREIFMTRLADLKQRALRFDVKYTYHHKLRNTIRCHTETGGNNNARDRDRERGDSPRRILTASSHGRDRGDRVGRGGREDKDRERDRGDRGDRGRSGSPINGQLSRSSTFTPNDFQQNTPGASLQSSLSYDLHTTSQTHSQTHTSQTNSSQSHTSQTHSSQTHTTQTHSSQPSRREWGMRGSNLPSPTRKTSCHSMFKFSRQPSRINVIEKEKEKPPLPQMFADYQQLTESEFHRRELANEIAHLECLIEKATLTEAKEEQALHEQEVFSQRNNDTGSNRTLTPNPSQFRPGPKPQKAFDTSRLCEIATLQWPMLFGEACVLDPASGLSRGTIVTDTTCELFLIHKSQMQTFLIESPMLEKIKQKAVQYPDDTVLVASLAKKEGWRKVRESLMGDIPKGRWPSRETDVEPMIF